MLAIGLIAGWVVGGALGYLAFRRDWRREFGEWTAGNRAIALLFSLSGPAFLFAACVCWLISKGLNSDRPARW